MFDVSIIFLYVNKFQSWPRTTRKCVFTLMPSFKFKVYQVANYLFIFHLRRDAQWLCSQSTLCANLFPSFQ